MRGQRRKPRRKGTVAGTCTPVRKYLVLPVGKSGHESRTKKGAFDACACMQGTLGWQKRGGKLHELFHSLKNGIEVGLLRHLGHQLDILDLAILNYEHGTGEQAQLVDVDAPGFAEGAFAVVGERYDGLDASGSAPAGLGEGQIAGDGDNDDLVGQTGRFGVEAADFHVADGGVQRWHAYQHQNLVLIVGKGLGLEAVVGKTEVRSHDTGLGHVTNEVHEVTFELNCSGHKCFLLKVAGLGECSAIYLVDICVHCKEQKKML